MLLKGGNPIPALCPLDPKQPGKQAGAFFALWSKGIDKYICI